MPKRESKFGKPPSCWNSEHAYPRPESDFYLTPPPGIQSQPSNAAEMEAPLRRAASETTRSRAYLGFISRIAFFSPNAHHLDEQTARIAALAYEAGFVIKSPDSFREDLGSAIATRMKLCPTSTSGKRRRSPSTSSRGAAGGAVESARGAQDAGLHVSCSSTMPTRWRKWRASQCRSCGAQNQCEG